MAGAAACTGRRQRLRVVRKASPTKPPAVVVGLDSSQGLQLTRILARRDVPVFALARDPGNANCRSRIPKEIRIADTSGDDLIPALEALGERLEQKAVLFPCQDLNVGLVSRHRERLATWYHIALPDPEVVELLLDKVRFYTYARERGLPIPPTHFLRTRADAERVAGETRYPAILKPPFRSAVWTRHTYLKAFKVFGPEELVAVYDRYRPYTDVLIAQASIEGPDINHFTCNCYFDASSEPVVTFVSRKLRQWPPETGEGCLGEGWRNDVVRNVAVDLFRSLRYRGLGYLEMKRDARSGDYFIIEPNTGRPTGRSATAEAAGVELHYSMYCDALGWPLPEGRLQTDVEIKWIHLRRDFQSALYDWRRGRLSLAAWIRSLRGRKTYALFSLRDPRPFLADLKHAAVLTLSRREREKRVPRSQPANHATNIV
jgi:predicted ATP-grasp superfamily ATP-dependent carboligase